MRTVLYLSALRKLCSKIAPVSRLRSFALITAPARASLMCSTVTTCSSWPSISNIVPLRKSLVEITELPGLSGGSGHREIWRSRWSGPKAGPGPLTRGSGRLGSKDPVIRLSLLSQILHCQFVALETEPGDHASRRARRHALGTELFARVDVRDVDLDRRNLERLKAVVKRERVVGQRRRVDHDPDCARCFLLQEVDDRALVVALKNAHRHAQLARLGSQCLEQVGQ